MKQLNFLALFAALLAFSTGFPLAAYENGMALGGCKLSAVPQEGAEEEVNRMHTTSEQETGTRRVRNWRTFSSFSPLIVALFAKGVRV